MSAAWVKWHLGPLRGEELVTITIKERANVPLIDASILGSYERGQRFRSTGSSPSLADPPAGPAQRARRLHRRRNRGASCDRPSRCCLGNSGRHRGPRSGTHGV